ncbi:MAG TPA: gamma-glutamyltransferase family protein [Planctomycetota bacterium]|nr:gamma-glutamyltransferase family protein [Planctomycetota bacterium]
MKVARSQKGMVVAAHPLAAEAGREILAEGGNAVEAAVAVSLALGVVEPFASGLGGGGFMIVSPSGSIGKTEVLDGRAKVSSLLTEEYVYPRGVMLPWVPKIGPLSVAVPGLARLLDTALKKFGRKMPLSRLARRAIALAADGFEVGEVYVYCSALFESTVRSTPECARIFYNNGVRFKPGERLVQKDLARTLRIVADRGFEACYTGEVGLAMARAVNATGPVWGRDDLARYEVKIRPPLSADVAGHRVATTPPPSRGGAGILQTLLRYDPDPVALARLLRTIFRELDPVVGDPDLMPVDLTKLSEGPQGPPGGGGTSHFVVVDSEGTVVSMSQTIGHFFGSGVIAQGYGVLLNDDLSDMERFPGHPNSIAAGKRSVANMAPTIVFRQGRPRLALGTPGSLRIFPALAQVIGNVLFQGMDLERAVAAGRVHWEDNRFFFEGDIPEEIRARARRELDQPVSERRRQDLFFGGVHGVEILDDGTIVGVADPRREGVALPL